MFSKRILFGILFLCASFLLYAQVDKSNYALLWEVSGKDLNQKSWLFGSMHVQDVRAFEFSDSVLITAQQADAFAMEVHPDEMIDFMMQMFTLDDTTNVLKEMLSPEAYKRLDELVMKKEGKPIDSLENKDPFWIELLLSDFDEPEDTEKRDQPVDLFFYKLFKLQNKGIFGLEKMKDYQNLTRSFFQMFEKNSYPTDYEPTQEEIRAQYEEMLDLYRRGDIGELEKYVNSFATDDAYEYEMLGARNIKMVKSFLALAKKQSLFGVVGTAHLPGKDGMLELLRQQGYSVRKITADFNGLAEKFKMPENNIPWVPTQNGDFGYTVQTPTKFQPITAFDIPGFDIDMRMSMDFLEMNMYMTMNMNYFLDTPKKAGKANFFEEIIRGWDGEGNMEILDKYPISSNGLDGYHFVTRNEGEAYQWWHVFFRENEKIINIFCVWRETNTQNRKDIDKFFDSISLVPPPPPASALIKYENKEGAFAVQLPTEPSHRWLKKVESLGEGTADRQLRVHIFDCVKKGNQSRFMVRYNNLGEGKIFTNVKADLETQINALASVWGKPKEDMVHREFLGNPAIETVFEVEKTYLHCMAVSRNNRLYLLVAQVMDSKKQKAEIDDFFNSFKFLPFEHMPLNKTKIPDYDVTIGFPGNFVTDTVAITSTDYPTISELNNYSTDTLSGISYGLLQYEFSPYHEAPDPSQFYQEYKESLCNQEPLELCQEITFQGAPAWEMITPPTNSNPYIHRLIFFRNHLLVELLATGVEDSKGKLAWEYFNSFNYSKEFDKAYYEKDRSSNLLQDLVSKDLSLREQAGTGLDNHEFTKEELPLIYAVLEKSYPHDTVYKNSIHDLLFYELENYVNDETTIPFLKELFHKKRDDFEVQKGILKTLGGLQTKESFKAFFDLCKGYRADQYDGYVYKDAFQSLRDTLELTAEFYSDILELQKSESLEYDAYRLIFNLLQKDLLSKELANQNRTFIYEKVKAFSDKYDLTAQKDSLPSIDKFWHLDALLIILGELDPSPEVDALLTSLQNIPSRKLQVTIVDAMLMHGLEVNHSAFKRISEEHYYFYELMKNLDFEGRLDVIPSNLISQEAIVAAKVHDDIEYRMDLITMFEIIDKKPYKYEDEKLNLYRYKFSVTGYNGTYLGVCSQPKDSNSYEVFPKLYDYSVTKLTDDNLEEVYKEILEEFDN